MKPDVARFLEVMAAQLMLEMAPALEPRYRQASLFASAVLLQAVAEEYDRAAARRVEENREIRRLFREALPVVEAGDLRGRLDKAAAGGDPGLRVADLERANAELRGLLIELHAHVEELDTPPARRVEEQIWRELAASTERRRIALNPF